MWYPCCERSWNIVNLYLNLNLTTQDIYQWNRTWDTMHRTMPGMENAQFDNHFETSSSQITRCKPGAQPLAVRQFEYGLCATASYNVLIAARPLLIGPVMRIRHEETLMPIRNHRRGARCPCDRASCSCSRRSLCRLCSRFCFFRSYFRFCLRRSYRQSRERRRPRHRHQSAVATDEGYDDERCLTSVVSCFSPLLLPFFVFAPCFFKKGPLAKNYHIINEVQRCCET